MIDACLKVDFAPEQTFVDISNWGVKEIGIITTGKELPFTGHFDFAGMMLKSSNSASGVFQNIGANGIVENVKCDFTDSRLAHTNSGIVRNVQSRNTYSANVNKTGGILYLNNGTVFNATVWAEAKSDVTVLNYNDFGGVVNSNFGTIDNCIFYGANVDSTAVRFGGIACAAGGGEATEVGSVVTFTRGIFKNCRVYMPQNKSFLVESCFGGITVGGSYVYIDNCTASIRITGLIMINEKSDFYYIGGIAGAVAAPAVIKNSSSSGTISDDKNAANLIGGIVGRAHSSETKKQVQISNCENTISIKLIATQIGGILGQGFYVGSPLALSITNCNNRGSISGTSSIGGIIGEMRTAASMTTVTDCINYGDITASNYNSGGIIGDYDYCGGTLSDSENYGNILLGSGVLANSGYKGGFVGSGSNNVGGLTISNCISYATIVDNVATSSLVGALDTSDKLVNCKVFNITGKTVYHSKGEAKSAATGVVVYLTPTEIPAEKPKPEVVKTMIMEADNVIKYQLDFNTDLIPAGTKIYSYKISVDGGSYFTQLIHKEYVLCKIDTAEIASSISIGKGVGQYSSLTFSYIAQTEKGKCMVLIRLSNNREYYL